MGLIKNPSCNLFYVILSSFVFLGLQFNYFPALGQKLESQHMSEFNTGDSIYLITNREKFTENNVLKFNNSVKEGEEFNYLKATFIKPDSLKMEVLDSSVFIKQISSINNDYLLFIHGDSKTFEQSIMRGLDIQHLYNAMVIVFNWPAKDVNMNGIKNFKNSKKNTIKSDIHFVQLMEFMESFRETNEYFPDRKLSLLFHSLGNSLIMNYSLCDTCLRFNSIIFDNIILNSAAVNQFEHKYWVEKLDFQERIFIISNRSDFNLKGVRIFTKEGKQLGEKIKSPFAENAEYLNFSKAVGLRTPTGTTHTFFIGEIPDINKDIYNIYYRLFHGKELDFSDSEVFKKRKDGHGYNIVKTKIK
ncbi:MAG: hypothetical protein C0595_02630 [Marinilabiliales bacterium]|nr:MAG: hypothetical protein C0595_02630 [Marinilabiliales bacterium]